MSANRGKIQKGTEMPKSFGVRCRKCGKHIHLADYDSENKDQITFYAVPLDPIPCPQCGHTERYDSQDKEYT